MPPTAKSRAMAKGNGVPDGHDIEAVLSDIYTDFGVSAEVHIYQDLLSDLIIEVMGQYKVDEQKSHYFTCWRRFTPLSRPLDALILICAHELWHECDRLKLRYPK